MILWKEMPREFLVFDRSGCSERIILLHVRDFSSSSSEIDEFHGNEFKETMALGVGALENAKMLQEVGSWGSSSSEVAGSMADEKKKQQHLAGSMADEKKKQQHVEMEDDGERNCYSGEDGDEIDVLLNLGDKLADTADSLKVSGGHRSCQRLEETFQILRDLVGGDWMDTVDVLDEAIRRVKRLQMDLRNLKDSCDM